MAFAEYIRVTRFDKKLSLQDVEDRSLGRISRGYVNQIENGQVDVGTISLDKLDSLAKGLGVPFEELMDAARDARPAGSKSRMEILMESFGGVDLPEAEVREIERVIEIMVEEKRKKVWEAGLDGLTYEQIYGK